MYKEWNWEINILYLVSTKDTPVVKITMGHCALLFWYFIKLLPRKRWVNLQTQILKYVRTPDHQRCPDIDP